MIPEKTHQKSNFTDFPVLFEDENVIAVDKPSSVLSHPNPGKSSAPAAFHGRYHFEERRFDTPSGPVWLVHRLDQETSGVLLATKNQKTAEHCRKMFEEGKVEKLYQAILVGKFKEESGIWKDHIMKKRTETAVRSTILKNKPFNSELRFKVVGRYPTPRKVLDSLPPIYSRSGLEYLTGVEIQLITGKTHQIRVQAAERGFPVLGDEIYGNFKLNKAFRAEMKLNRLFLHAKSLKISLPNQKSPVQVISKLPQELDFLVQSLKK